MYKNTVQYSTYQNNWMMARRSMVVVGGGGGGGRRGGGYDRGRTVQYTIQYVICNMKITITVHY